MGYVGNQTTNSYTSMDKQTITGNGGASYTLDHAVANVNEIEVFVNNVRQEPSVAYTVSGTALTMTGNVAASDDFYVVFQGKALQTTVPPDDSVTTARINDGAVTTAKIAANAVTSAKMFSGFANGIAEFDLYAVNGTVSRGGQGTTVLTTQFTRFTQDFEKIGTGITNTSGVFSFPSTGKYVVSAKFLTVAGAANGYFGVKIQTTTDNSTYADRSVSYNCSAGSNNYVDAFTQLPFDVTDTSNDKVRFVFETAGSGNLQGGTTALSSYVSFVKLADT